MSGVAAPVPVEPVLSAPPAVRVITRPLVTGGTEHAFQLVVSSSGGLGAAKVDAGDVLVSGPRQFSKAAHVSQAVASADGTRMLVTCRIAAPGGTFDGADNGLYRIILREGALNDGTAVSLPARVVGAFRVAARRPLPSQATPVLPIPAAATAGALTVELNRVIAWTDRMPVIGPDGPRRYMILSATMTNTSDAPLEVRLDRGYLSFDEGQVGTPTDGISLRGSNGLASGQKSLVLQPGERRVVQFRGDGLFTDDKAGQRLFVTLEFSAAGATAFVRNSGIVGVTY
jgi:hypothetical protein